MANKKKTKSKNSGSSAKKNNTNSTKKVSSTKKKNSTVKKVSSNKKKTTTSAKKSANSKNSNVKQNYNAKAVESSAKVKEKLSLKQYDFTKLSDIKAFLMVCLKMIWDFIITLCSKCKNKFCTLLNKLKKGKKNKKNIKNKNVKKVLSKNINDSVKKKKEVVITNPFLKILYKLWNNSFVLFNATLIITYLLLLIGLCRTDAFSVGSIVYISCIVIFLMFVGMCYSKYLSGKIFCLFIIFGMSLAIYQLQYTYDFFNNLNSGKYEYKEYYVVTFDNGSNKSIYNINNKRVGLLKDNSTNVQRILNIKLDNVNYVEFDDPNLFYSAFFESECRAIIVNENQYKYLLNYIEENSRNVKILYTFKANGLK